MQCTRCLPASAAGERTLRPGRNVCVARWVRRGRVSTTRSDKLSMNSQLRLSHVGVAAAPRARATANAATFGVDPHRAPLRRARADNAWASHIPLKSFLRVLRSSKWKQGFPSPRRGEVQGGGLGLTHHPASKKQAAREEKPRARTAAPRKISRRATEAHARTPSPVTPATARKTATAVGHGKQYPGTPIQYPKAWQIKVPASAGSPSGRTSIRAHQ